MRLHYVDEGPKDGPVVLLVHGNPTWSYLWRHQLRELPAAGHRCVAFDHMGFGRSDKPPHLSAYSLQAHIDNAVAVIDELDLRDVVLVAHDWGGPIGLGAILERADRLRGLVVMNTWAWELPSFLPPFVREFRTEGLGEILALGGNLFVESIPGGMARRDTDPVMMDAYRAPFPDYWSRVGTLAFQRDIPLSERDRSASLIASIQERLTDARGAGAAHLGHARPRVPAGLPRSVARAVPGGPLGRAGRCGALPRRGPPRRRHPVDRRVPSGALSQLRSIFRAIDSALGLLGAIERGVGLGVEGARVERARLGGAHGERHLTGDLHALRHGVAHAPAHQLGVVEPGLAQDERELVAPDPVALIGGAAARDEPADLGEDGIAALVAEALVDAPEAVDVEEHAATAASRSGPRAPTRG